VNFRRFASLSAATTPLTEGVTPLGSELSVSAITVTPAQYGDYIKISDILDFTAPDPVLTEGGQILAEQAANTIDQLVRDVVVAGTTVQYAAGRADRASITSADKLNATEIQKATRTMRVNKVRKLTSILNASTGVGTKPIAAAFVGITDAYGLFDLKQDSKFIQVHEYGSGQGALLPNEVGSLDEVRFIVTDNPKVYTGAGSGGIDVHATIILGADAFGIVAPKGVENIIKPFGAGDDPLNQRATSGWKMFMASVILQQLAVLRIEHAVS
jgi:N4-gp56 family major capsid protein